VFNHYVLKSTNINLKSAVIFITLMFLSSSQIYVVLSRRYSWNSNSR